MWHYIPEEQRPERGSFSFMHIRKIYTVILGTTVVK
jgi:hypothetical protein